MKASILIVNMAKKLFFISLVSFLKKVEDESVGVFFLQLESFFNGIVFLFSSFSGVGIPLQNMPCPTPLYYLKIIPPAKSYSYGGKIQIYGNHRYL